MKIAELRPEDWILLNELIHLDKLQMGVPACEVEDIEWSYFETMPKRSLEMNSSREKSGRRNSRFLFQS